MAQRDLFRGDVVLVSDPKEGHAMKTPEEEREQAHAACHGRGPIGISCGDDCTVPLGTEEALEIFRRTCFIVTSKKTNDEEPSR